MLDAGDSAVLAHRCDWEGATILAAHNPAGREAHARLRLGDAPEGTVLVDLFDHDQRALGAGGSASIALAPYGRRWYRLRRPGQRAAP